MLFTYGSFNQLGFITTSLRTWPLWAKAFFPDKIYINCMSLDWKMLNMLVAISNFLDIYLGQLALCTCAQICVPYNIPKIWWLVAHPLMSRKFNFLLRILFGIIVYCHDNHHLCIAAKGILWWYTAFVTKSLLLYDEIT